MLRTFRRIIKNFWCDFRKENLAENPNTSSEILSILSKDVYWAIRWKVAENPNTSTETLDQLSTDKDWKVRHTVAENINSSQEALDLLSSDHDPCVRLMVAENPNTPKYIKKYFYYKLFYLTH